jgi:hypothetical protein
VSVVVRTGHLSSITPHREKMSNGFAVAVKDFQQSRTQLVPKRERKFAKLGTNPSHFLAYSQVRVATLRVLHGNHLN